MSKKIAAINGNLLKITSVETEIEALIKDKNRRVQCKQDFVPR
jgi:hypothetical protein